MRLTSGAALLHPYFTSEYTLVSQGEILSNHFILTFISL